MNLLLQQMVLCYPKIEDDEQMLTPISLSTTETNIIKKPTFGVEFQKANIPRNIMNFLENKLSNEC